MTLAPECWVGKGQSLKQPPVEVIFFGGLEKNISCWISQPQNSGLTFFFLGGGKGRFKVCGHFTGVAFWVKTFNFKKHLAFSPLSMVNYTNYEGGKPWPWLNLF